MTKPTLALIDDEASFIDGLKPFLEAEGFTVRTYRDGSSGLDGLLRQQPDLAIVDVKMPAMDGLTLVQRLRSTSNVPVIMLTSADDEIDEVVALRIGADDFIRKSASNRLIVQRVRAVLRRVHGPPPGAEEGAQPVINRGPLFLDPNRHLCEWGGRKVDLTVTEYLILAFLANRPGVVRNRDALMTAAYDDGTYVEDRTIDTHIKRIRRKFREVDGTFEAINTHYGIGYTFEVPTQRTVG
jgi:two-component system response regulator ChvI